MIKAEQKPDNGALARSDGTQDIWAPDHLARLAAVYAVEPQVDVAVSGCAFHLPHGMPAPYVTGLFDTPDATGKHFFPPSSFSHRRDLTDRIGPWRDPFICKAPVDCDLLLRAVAQGCMFRSTGQITTHKFAAGHRYLSYLCDAVSRHLHLNLLMHLAEKILLMQPLTFGGDYRPTSSNKRHSAPHDLFVSRFACLRVIEYPSLNR